MIGYKRTIAIVLFWMVAALPFASSAQLVTYVHTDALGSPVARTNASGLVIRRNEYEPFGKLASGTSEDGPGFTGHVTDAATGLSYMQQRYYDPTIGRFLSVDPVTADAATGANFNRYWYANNNPYRYTDPDGRVAYQVGNTIVIPIYYQGTGATREFIDSQVKAASQLVTEDGTKFQIVPLKNNMFPRGNIMDVSPGNNPHTVRGEGILHGFNGSVAHIDSGNSVLAGAVLHDSLHFIPGLSDGRKSDGYRESVSDEGERIIFGYKPGFSEDQIMADRRGNMLKAFETSFVNHANNGNGSEQELKKLLEDDANK